MDNYGYIFDKSSIKQQLKEANRGYDGRKTWENLYGSIDLAKQQQTSKLKQDYSKAISDAYASSYASNSAIASSNIGEGYKEAAMLEIDNALEAAYDSYRNNYLSSLSEVEGVANEAASSVTESLDYQAENTKKFAEKPYEYLQYLFNKYSEGSNDVNPFYTNEQWKKYTYEETDDNGELTGNRLLKSWDDVMSVGAKSTYIDENGNEQSEWTGLFDDKGNLTIKGVDFYDQIINQKAYEGSVDSFGSWLAQTDSDLYDWSTSYNPYDYNDAQTNLGSFKTLVGLGSTDEQYSFIERFGGLGKTEIDGMFSKFTDKVSELEKKVSDSTGRYGKATIKDYESLTNEIKHITDDLGITEDIENDMGMSFDGLAEYMSNLVSNSSSNADIWLESGLSALSLGLGTGGLAYQTAAAGTAGTTAAMLGETAAASSSAGPAGWIIAAVFAVAAATATGISTSESMKKQNKQNEIVAKNAYNDLVANLVAYSHSKRRQVQGDFYKHNR